MSKYLSNGWCALTNDINQWIILDLTTNTLIDRIHVRPRIYSYSLCCFVNTLTIETSPDKSTWTS